jgi:hypothetical protein
MRYAQPSTYLLIQLLTERQRESSLSTVEDEGIPIDVDVQSMADSREGQTAK